MKLIAYQDDRLLWETDDGHGRVTDESGTVLTVDPDQSVESIMSRGYWKVLPHVAKHASEVHPGTGTNQRVHAGGAAYEGPGEPTGDGARESGDTAATNGQQKLRDEAPGESPTTRDVTPAAQGRLDAARETVTRMAEALAGRGPAPWAASIEDVAAGKVTGMKYRAGGEHSPEASWAGDHMVVSDKFFDLPLAARRLVVAHEIGHNLVDALADDDIDTMWNLAESGAMGERKFRGDKFLGIWGPNGQSKPEEILAEAYSILWGDGGDEWLRGWRDGELYEAVVGAAQRFGFPLPEGVAAAGEGERMFDEAPAKMGPWEPTDEPLDLQSIEGRGSTPARITRTNYDEDPIRGKKETTITGTVSKSAVQARVSAVIADLGEQLGIDFGGVKLHWDVDEFADAYRSDSYAATGVTKDPGAAAAFYAEDGTMHIGPGVLKDMIDFPQDSAYLVVVHEALHHAQSVKTFRGQLKDFGEGAAELLATAYGVSRLDLSGDMAQRRVFNGYDENGDSTYRKPANPLEAIMASRAYIDRQAEVILQSARRVGWDRQAILTDITDTFMHGSEDDWLGFYRDESGESVYLDEMPRKRSYYDQGRIVSAYDEVRGREAADAMYAEAERAGVPLDTSVPNWKDFAWDTATPENDYRMQRTPEAEDMARIEARQESLIMWLLGGAE